MDNYSKYKKLLDSVPTQVLLRAARERNAGLRETMGKYAAQKVLRPCKHCSQMLGAREMRLPERHKPNCPKRVKAEKAA